MIFFKRILILLICLQIVVPQHFQADLLRFPVLVAHFVHHNDHHKPIGFSSFLVKHLVENDYQETDREEHAHLPFQKHSHDCTSHQITLAYFINKDMALVPFSVLNANARSVYNENFTSNFLANIWQPPQLA